MKHCLTLLVHGRWSGWSAWDTCSVSCGGGQRSRRRLCNKPEPKNGGRDCIGFPDQLDYCNSDPCPSKLGIIVQVSPRVSSLGIRTSVGSPSSPQSMEGEDSEDKMHVAVRESGAASNSSKNVTSAGSGIRVVLSEGEPDEAIVIDKSDGTSGRGVCINFACCCFMLRLLRLITCDIVSPAATYRLH